MSGMGSRAVDSLLPTDIEERLAKVQLVISQLERQRMTLADDVEAKKALLVAVNADLTAANVELIKVKDSSETISAALSDRELKISQKESALNVYANALQEKEKKINKYLALFESMKDVVVS